MPSPTPPALNHHFFSGVFLALLCMAAALGAIVSADFASGAAIVNGSDGFATVKMGLWSGTSLVAGRHQTVYYEWCNAESPSFHYAHCTQLQAARVSACVGVGVLVALLAVLALLATFAVRVRLEPKLARVAAGLCVTAASCFALCLAVWAVLILDLSSSRGEGNKAQLSIGISWLAEGGAFILAFLLVVNMVQTARRIEVELAATLSKSGGMGRDEESVAVVAMAMSTTKQDKARRSSSKASHGGGEMETA